MRSTRRLLVLGLALTFTPMGVLATAPTAAADCTSSGYSSVCAQGDVRGPDGVPRAATPVVPYPCAYDWYCNTGVDLDIGWDRPNRPDGGGGIGPRR